MLSQVDYRDRHILIPFGCAQTRSWIEIILSTNYLSTKFKIQDDEQSWPFLSFFSRIFMDRQLRFALQPVRNSKILVKTLWKLPASTDADPNSPNNP